MTQFDDAPSGVKEERDITLLGFIRVGFYAVLYFSIGLICNGILLSTLFLYPFAPELAYEVNSRTAFALWWLMQWVWEDHKGAVVTFSGDGVPDGENAIVLANHLSYSDFYLINALALRKGMLPYCRWFAKADLKWQLPIFGLSMWLLGMIMVKRDWLKDSESTRQAFLDLKKPEGKGKKIWLVTFLEGTRKTDKKLAESQKFSEKNGKPVLKNLLFPRTKGFVAAVKELRGSQVTHVYDLTLAYRSSSPSLPQPSFGHPASLFTIHSRRRISPPFHYHLHVRRYPLSSLPSDDEGIAKWAEARWVEKDRLLEGMKDEKADGQGWTLYQGLSGRLGGGSGDPGSTAYGVYRDDHWSKSKGSRHR